MRLTSIKAYETIRDNGMLRGIKLLVLEHLSHAEAPMTAGEVAWAIQDHQLDSVRPRFAQLAKSGLIRTAGERKCTVTGMNALVWELTGELPQKVNPVPKDKTCVIKTAKELSDICSQYCQCMKDDA